jgi:hypothetical protein
MDQPSMQLIAPGGSVIQQFGEQMFHRIQSAVAVEEGEEQQPLSIPTMQTHREQNQQNQSALSLRQP